MSSAGRRSRPPRLLSAKAFPPGHSDVHVPRLLPPARSRATTSAPPGGSTALEEFGTRVAAAHIPPRLSPGTAASSRWHRPGRSFEAVTGRFSVRDRFLSLVSSYASAREEGQGL